MGDEFDHMRSAVRNGKSHVESRIIESVSLGGIVTIRGARILTQRFDTTSFKKALPDVYKAFIKQSASRRFTITA